MKKTLTVMLAAFLIAACNNSDKNEAAENDIDAARQFIQAALRSDYQKARAYMIQDTPNLARMSAVERVHLPPEEKKGLAGATINIHNINRVDTVTTIVIFSNSFKNNHDTLRVKKINGQWLVDLDYLFTHDTDSLTHIPLLPGDTLPAE
ncbi:MAG TPA: hypothetical protein PKC69_09795 [Chitinophagaceae bacterium]|nr:hypothetical protein [Chitinophagaceae bacterium]